MEKPWNLKKKTLNNHGKILAFYVRNNLMKLPVARKLAVRHTSFVCLTASFLATCGFMFQLYQNACIVYKHAYLNTLLLLQSAYMLRVVNMSLKWEVGGHALNKVMEITLLIMEKSWNCVFEFLWEPCIML